MSDTITCHRADHRADRRQEVVRPGQRPQGRRPQGLPRQGHRPGRRQRRRQVDPHQGSRRRPALRRGRSPHRRRSTATCTPRGMPAQLGIEVVYQDLALCDNLDIVQNMFLGREELTFGTFDEGRMEKDASDTLRSPLGAHRQVGAPEGLVALRRPAPDRRDRPRRAEEGARGHPRRADRRARRRADRAGAQPRQAAVRAGRRGRSSSATTSPTSSRSPTTSPCSTSARWSRRSTSPTRPATTWSATSPAPRRWRRRAHRHDHDRHGRRRVSGTTRPKRRPSPLASDLIGSGVEGGLGDQIQAWWQRVRGGDMGALPAVGGLIVLSLLFSVLSPFFLTERNFANLLNQAATARRARHGAGVRAAARRDRPVRRCHRRRRHGAVRRAQRAVRHALAARAARSASASASSSARS